MTALRLATLVALVSIVPAIGVGQPAAPPAPPAPKAPAAPAPAATGAQKTVAVVALAGYDRLMEDVDFIGALAGKQASRDMVEGMIAFFTGGRGVEGLDKTRPIGMVLRTDGSAFTPLLVLPIANLDPVLELAENFGLEPVLGDNGVYEVATPEQTVYIRQAGEWTYAAQSAGALGNLPADPAQPLKQIVGTYDLGATLLAQNVPDMYRQIALEQLRQGMDEGMKQEEGEDDETFAKRRALGETQIDQLNDMIDGLDRLTFGWNVDAQKKLTNFDVEVTGKPGSDLALAMSVYDDARSGVTGFHRPEAAASLLTSATTPPALLEKQKEQVDTAVEMLRTQAKKALGESKELSDDPAVRDSLEAAANDLIDAYGDMLRSGRAEVGASLALDGESFDLIAGAFVADPAKVESAFKKLAEAAEKQDAEFSGVDWEYATHAGVKLHRMTVPVPDEQAEEFRKFFGDGLVLTMGVGADRVYLAAGPAGEGSLKAAIDRSAKMVSEPIKPAEAMVSVGKILTAVEKVAPPNEGTPFIGMMLDALDDAPAGTDRIVFTTEPIKSGVRVRYLVEEGVLQAVGKAAAAAAEMQARQQQQQGGGGF